MRVRERIYSLRLLEKMNTNPEYAKRLGLELISTSIKLKDAASKKNKTNCNIYNEKNKNM